jgi:hypothetical protein
LAVPAYALAASLGPLDVSQWHDTAQSCASTSDGSTCSGTDSQGFRVGGPVANVTVMNDTYWSDGYFASPSNDWNSSGRTWAVGVDALEISGNVSVSDTFYSANTTDTNPPAHTVDHEVGIGGSSPEAPAGVPSVGVDHHQIAGTYDHCFVTVNGQTAADVLCGPDSFHELPVTLP